MCQPGNLFKDDIIKWRKQDAGSQRTSVQTGFTGVGAVQIHLWYISKPLQFP